MPYHIYNKAGQELSGDKNLDQDMRDYADQHEGYIIDTDTGEVVHGTRPETEQE